MRRMCVCASVALSRSTRHGSNGGRCVRRARVSAASVSTIPHSVPRRHASTSATQHATLQQAQPSHDADAGVMLDTTAATSPVAVVAAAGNMDNDSDAATSWPEPTLADLDRSMPQVDCVFMASLTRHRRARREAFLRAKAQVKDKVQQLTRQQAMSVLDSGTLREVGQLDTTTRAAQHIRNEAAVSVTAPDNNDGGGGRGDDDGVTRSTGVGATTAMVPVVASEGVLQQLNEEERDLLYGTRPEYDDGFVLLDCRTVNEVTSWGIIEGAKVLPAHELFDAFHACPADFARDYGFAKPTPEQIIICYCQYGPRSLMAAQILSWLGYVKVLHFRDGYYEWGKQYNLLLRRWMEHDKASGNELRRLAAFQAGLELQRTIAPEFNALPMQEAARYRIDTTRSRGTMQIGDGLRAHAYALLERLTREDDDDGRAAIAAESAAPAALLDDGGSGTTLPDAVATTLSLPSSSTSVLRGTSRDTDGDAAMAHKSPVTDFLQRATGCDLS